MTRLMRWTAPDGVRVEFIMGATRPHELLAELWGVWMDSTDPRAADVFVHVLANGRIEETKPGQGWTNACLYVIAARYALGCPPLPSNLTPAA